jgi:segregation and condensation protein B
MGIDSLSDLPAIADFVPGADVVEALEHGLRVEVVIDPTLAASESSADDRPSLGDLLDGDQSA